MNTKTSQTERQKNKLLFASINLFVHEVLLTIILKGRQKLPERKIVKTYHWKELYCSGSSLLQ